MKQRFITHLLVGIALLPLTTVQAAAVSFILPDASTNAGGSANVDVQISDFVDVGGFQFSIEWDSSVFQFSSVQDFDHGGAAGTLSFFGPPGNPNSVNVNDAANGKISVLWDHPAQDVALADGSRLFSITFNAVGAAGSSTTLAFSDDPTSRAVASFTGNHPDFTSVSGSLTIVPEPRWVVGGFALGAMVIVRLLRRKEA